MKLLLPDACWQENLVSGALFLYFHEEPVGITVHPSASTFLTGTDPFEFIELVKERRPGWSDRFLEFVKYWLAYRASLSKTTHMLEPLRGTVLKTIWLVYNRDTVAWNSARELLASSDLPQNKLAAMIDPFSASDELFAHLFFGKFLELYLPNSTGGDLVEMGQTMAQSGLRMFSHGKVDWSVLYDYCGELFSEELDTLLTIAYMFRMPLLQREDVLVLTNPRLIPLLASLPVQLERRGPTQVPDERLDTVAWEFFRQLVSPVIDPLDEHRVQKVIEIVARDRGEIDRLKTRCLSLAAELAEETNLAVLQARIANHIRAKVGEEVKAILQIDQTSMRHVLDLVFSDQKTWAGIGLLLYSLFRGGEIMTAGSAIYALSSLGAKAFQVARRRQEILSTSGYTLFYRLKGI